MESFKQCKCGCGQEIIEKPHHKYRARIDFIHGHNGKGNHLSSKWATLIGKRAIERHFTNGMRKEICKMYVDDSLTCQEIAKKIGTHRNTVARRLQEENIKIKGLGGFRKGMPVSIETRRKLSKATAKTFQKPEFIKKYHEAMNIKPNKPEKKMLSLLEKFYPGQWKYTGDFSFTINGKCPDFVNCNGQKKVIELYGDYWHKGQNPQDRIDTFKPFGFETLVIWERELKDIEGVKNKIEEFQAT